MDALRGVCLVLMGVNHFGGPLTVLTWQPLGFVSAAEVFFFLSGFVGGHACTRVGLRAGGDLGPWAVGRRVRRIYKAHLATVLLGGSGLLLSAALVSGDTAYHAAWPALFDAPVVALGLAAALLALPPPLDILPLYIVFVLAVPVIVRRCLAGRWHRVAIVSFALWGLSQVTLGRLAHWVAHLVPPVQPPAFDVLGYQFVFVAGVLAGWHVAMEGQAKLGRLGARGIAAVAAVAIVLFVLRRVVTGESLFLQVLVGRPSFSPVRALNFVLLLLLAVNARAWLARAVQRGPLTLLGRQSIFAFSAHAVLLLWLRPWRGGIAALGPTADTLATLAFLAVMLAVAWTRERGRAALA